MSRVPLVGRIVGVLIACAAAAAAVDLGRHFEPGKLADDCTPCHAGHGAPRTPMLHDGGDEMCLSCHQSGAAEPGRREELGMGSSAEPADIRQELVKPILHRGARCVDCHSVHGVGRLELTAGGVLDLGRQKRSTKRGFAVEAELCLDCHGTRAASAADPHDLGLLFDPRNPSFHPVLALGVGEVPSLRPPLTSNSLVNCSDCHGNDEESAAGGPHGSRIAGLLRFDYSTQDGQPESPSSYALCYLCHDRDLLLDGGPFPFHRLHVVEQRSPCALCHDPHGSTTGRALVRFGEPTAITGVLPSSSGQLEFVSETAGDGACYLTCHGVDHDPLGYGPMYTAEGRPRFIDPSRDGGLRRGPAGAAVSRPDASRPEGSRR